MMGIDYDSRLVEYEKRNYYCGGYKKEGHSKHSCLDCHNFPMRS